MNLVELFLIAIGLAMDAFAVSVCKGLSMQKMDFKKAMLVGVYFGGFQALMPVIGYFLGIGFKEYINYVADWLSFGLLVFIGLKMIIESFKKEENPCVYCELGFKSMIVLAIATSIDALAVGVTFAFYEVNILIAAAIIGVITFVLSVCGVKIGNVFGAKFKSKAEFAGGLILILMGVKIILEHFNLINF